MNTEFTHRQFKCLLKTRYQLNSDKDYESESNEHRSKTVSVPMVKKMRDKYFPHQFTRSFLLVVSLSIGIFLQTATNSAYAIEKTVYEATYVVELNGMELGTSKRTVHIVDGQTIVSRHLLSPKGLAALLGEVETLDTTHIRISNSTRILPISLTRDSDRSSDSFVAEFKWRDRKIKFSNGEISQMPDYPVYDLEALILLLMVAPEKLAKNQRVDLLEKVGVLRTYVVESIQETEFNFDNQRFDALQFNLRSVSEVSRGYTISILPEFHNLPIQIVKHKESDSLSISIVDFQDFVS